MLESLQRTGEKALSELQNVADIDTLKEWRSRNLGKESVLMQTLGNLGSLPASDRPAIGRQANDIRRALETACQQRVDEWMFLVQRSIVQRNDDVSRLDAGAVGS